MVEGIKKFKEYFGAHNGKYAVIGGTACDILFGEVDLEFRATRDIDLVLCVAKIDPDFGASIKAFLEAGGYKTGEHDDGRKQFYRFLHPSTKGFPAMIEILTGDSSLNDFPKGLTLRRVEAEEDIVSLSAILLNTAYYNAFQKMKTEVDGITVIDEKLLIPLKALACLNLTEERKRTGPGQGDNIRKHRNDVFRLLQLLSTDSRIEIADEIRSDLRRFIALVEKEATLNPKAFGVDMTRQEGIDLLRSAYGL